MGSLKSTSSTRCRYAACFALGFVVASLILAAMFWIIWCYMGLSIVQISDTQRRALVNYSYTTSKPSTLSSTINRTEIDGALESSLNAISKSPATPPTQSRRGDSSTDLAKGDFASRSQGGASQNSTRQESIKPPVTSSSEDRKASILHKGEEDGLHPRKVSTSNTENRAPEIKPTQTYALAHSNPLPTAAKEEKSSISRDSDRKDEIQSSRPSYRDPEFEREPPPRRSETGRRRYVDEDDDYDRGSPSRYDKRDRGRDTDDRYSKGDTRVYPDERPLDDRYPPRDSDRRRGDDRYREDRYRDKDDRDGEERYRYKDDRDLEDRYRDRVDRGREDRYRDREDRYRDYDDRYRDRDRPYIDDGRNRRRDDRYDDRHTSRDDRYPPRYPDDDDRLRDRPYSDRRDRVITKDDEDRYTISRERDFKEPIMSSRDDISSDRKSGRPDDTRRPPNYDDPVRDRPRTTYIDESRTVDRYPSRDKEYFRPSKYSDRDRITSTRTIEDSISRSTMPLSRSRDDAYESESGIIAGRKRDDDRYSSNRDVSRYYGDNNRRVDDSRYISSSSVRETDSTRRDASRDDYPSRSLDDKKLEDVGLERRSYSVEEEEYRRRNSRTRYYDDADRKSSGDSRRDYRTDDDYSRRKIDDDEYRRSSPKGDYDTDKSRSSVRYDRPIDDDGRPSRRYLPEYDQPKRRTDADIGLRKESSPDVIDEDRTLLRRPEGRLPEKVRRYDEDSPPRRSLYGDTIDNRPLRPAIDKASEEGRRRYKDDVPSNPDDSPRRAPIRSEKDGAFVDSSSPLDVVVREKRYHNSGKPYDDSGIDERPINTKDVIEAALKHPDSRNLNPREVIYPVFDPRLSNLTATDNIPLSDRRGTTITSRRRKRESRSTF